ncbi:hypothetical protein CO083_04300, partial [Candidatus Roizmanbacteria bacterium CG_4_9_14_0_8_um_filter_34_12]
FLVFTYVKSEDKRIIKIVNSFGSQRKDKLYKLVFKPNNCIFFISSDETLLGTELKITNLIRKFITMPISKAPINLYIFFFISEM